MVLFNNVFFAVLIVLSILANGSLAQATDSATGCLRGPNFWCLNDTTEGLCNFTDKAIGLCGYTSKRCQIKTGNVSLVERDLIRIFLSLFNRGCILQILTTCSTTVGIEIQRRINRCRRESLCLLHSQSVLATVQLSTHLQWNQRAVELLLFPLYQCRSAGQWTSRFAWSLADILDRWKLSRLATVLFFQAHRLVNVSHRRQSMPVEKHHSKRLHSGALRVLSG